jgi:hypothetical protein
VEYREFLRRAVSQIDNRTPEERQAVYGRMREYLLRALGTITPKLPQNEIAARRQQLENEIMSVEAFLAQSGGITDLVLESSDEVRSNGSDHKRDAAEDSRTEIARQARAALSAQIVPDGATEHNQLSKLDEAILEAIHRALQSAGSK